MTLPAQIESEYRRTQPIDSQHALNVSVVAAGPWHRSSTSVDFARPIKRAAIVAWDSAHGLWHVIQQYSDESALAAAKRTRDVNGYVDSYSDLPSAMKAFALAVEAHADHVSL